MVNLSDGSRTELTALLADLKQHKSKLDAEITRNSEAYYEVDRQVSSIEILLGFEQKNTRIDRDTVSAVGGEAVDAGYYRTMTKQGGLRRG